MPYGPSDYHRDNNNIPKICIGYIFALHKRFKLIQLQCTAKIIF